VQKSPALGPDAARSARSSGDANLPASLMVEGPRWASRQEAEGR